MTLLLAILRILACALTLTHMRPVSPSWAGQTQRRSRRSDSAPLEYG